MPKIFKWRLITVRKVFLVYWYIREPLGWPRNLHMCQKFGIRSGGVKLDGAAVDANKLATMASVLYKYHEIVLQI